MNQNLLEMLNSFDDNKAERSEILRAPFAYPGSKYRSLDEIIPEMEYRNTYIEPFGGSGNVLFARKMSNLEVFNDRYAGIVCFYRVIRDRQKMKLLQERISQSLHSREEWTWSHDTWENCEDEIERAARWYYMSCCSFAAKGKAFGRSIKGKGMIGQKLHGNVKHFGPVHNRLRNVQIENQDWRQIFKDYNVNDSIIWYLDPPYYPGVTTTGIYIHEMSKEHHVELCDRIFGCHGYSGLYGCVYLSGYDNPVYNRYPWTRVKKWLTRVSMTGAAFNEENHLAGLEDTMKRGEAEECLYILER